MGGQGGPGGAMMGGATTIAGAPAVLQGGAGQTAIGSEVLHLSLLKKVAEYYCCRSGWKTRLIKPFSFIKRAICKI